jgi:hypothetical protein
MMKRILSRRLWVLAVVVSLVIATGCGGSQPVESQLGPLEKAEASQELSAAMAVWLPDNADKVGDQVGMWVALGAPPLSNDVAADAVRDALLAEPDIAVAQVEAAKGTDSYKGTVNVSFNTTFTLSPGLLLGGTDDDPGIEKELHVTISFDVTVTDGEVVEASTGYDVDVDIIGD